MSLYENINKRKRAGTSRPKSKSTITAKNYSNMKKGFPKKKKLKKATEEQFNELHQLVTQEFFRQS